MCDLEGTALNIGGKNSDDDFDFVIDTTTNTSDIPVNNDNSTYVIHVDLNREQYEEDLKRRQEEHLKRIRENQQQEFGKPYENPYQPPWQPCLHDGCSQCHGTGLKFDGTVCIHNLSCTCPKCSVYC